MPVKSLSSLFVGKRPKQRKDAKGSDKVRRQRKALRGRRQKVPTKSIG